MITYPITNGVPAFADPRAPRPDHYGAWSDAAGQYLREFSDLFGLADLSRPPAITTLYNGAGISVDPKFLGATWHNWPNTAESAIRRSISGRVLDGLNMRVKWIRSHDYYPNSAGSLRWHHLEASKGNFEWSNFDRFIGDAKAAGLETMITFGYSPAWATGVGSGDSHYDNGAVPISSSNAPTSMIDWTDMVGAVFNRYGNQIDFAECWNEPETTAFYNGTNTQYAQLLRLLNQTAKGIHSGVKIVGPASSNVSSQGRSKLTNILAASDGAGGTGAGSAGLATIWLDVVSFHQYFSGPLNLSLFASDYAAYKAVLSGAGLGALPLWCDELGVNQVHAAGADDSPNARSPQMLAYLLRMIYLMAASGVQRVNLYDIDGRRLSPFYYASDPDAAVQEVHRHLDYLLSGVVTRINMLADGRLAIVAGAENFLL